MSKLAEIYRQANENVLKKYQESPEDIWRVTAIADFRAGGKVAHENAMFKLAQDIESEVDRLLMDTPMVESTPISTSKTPVEASLEPIKPTQPH